MAEENSPVKTVAVITPTTGKDCLKDVLTSIQLQEYSAVNHYIIVDGPAFLESARTIAIQVNGHADNVFVIPDNTGGSGYNGHRVYAAFSYLINEDVIMYLDEDNFIEPDHISSLIGLLNVKNLDWAYSLRKIHDQNGEFLIEDNCESIGRWPCISRGPEFVDTNCYAIRRTVINQTGHAWFYPRGADRVLYNALRNYTDNFDCTGMYTVNYRLRDDMPQDIDFFLNGNKAMELKYGLPLPWQQPYHLNTKALELDQWSVESSLLNLMKTKLFPGANILEFGSGDGTGELLKHFTVTSVEHNPEYVMVRTKNHLCYFAPLENGWYNPDVVQQAIEQGHPHCILIDGPPNENRGNILNHIAFFKGYNGYFVFDDLNRNPDYMICEKFCAELSYDFEVFKGKNKHFALCSPK